jgi:hypothetical protein
VAPENKRAAIEAALEEFRNGDRNVMSDEEWRAPAAHHNH